MASKSAAKLWICWEKDSQIIKMATDNDKQRFQFELEVELGQRPAWSLSTVLKHSILGYVNPALRVILGVEILVIVLLY